MHATDPLETGCLPPQVAAALWRGHELGLAPARTVPTGHTGLDAELPGGGWPCQGLTEILQPQPALCEWRLLGPGLRAVAAAGGQIILVGPPRHPHLPGLQQAGLRDEGLVWVDAVSPSERLWATEQLIQSRPDGAVLAWLPQARPEQLRRLQVHAQACDAPVFLFRPAVAARESSPAALRVEVTLATDWQLQVRLLKRRGPVHDTPLLLSAVPEALAGVMTPRSRHPGSSLPRILEVPRVADALDRPAARPPARSTLAH